MAIIQQCVPVNGGNPSPPWLAQLLLEITVSR